MQSPQDIERMFKMLQEYKECRNSKTTKPSDSPPRCKEEVARIAELVDKIKH